MSGVAVTFTVSAGSGSRTVVTGTSGADGKVSANWTLGTTAGGLQTLTVSSTGLTSIHFTATATAGSPTKLVLSGPSSATAGACSTALTVTRQDANSNAAAPASSTTVLLSGVGAGSFYTASDCLSGAVTSTSIASGASAVTLYFKDATAQSLTLAADASGLTGGMLAFAVNVGALHHLAKVSGDAQSGIAGAALASAIVARAEDASNNPLSGVAVTFSVTLGGGSRTVVTGTSAADGLVSANWTLGATAGATQTLTAAASGVTTISYSATATAGTPTKLVLAGPSSVTAGACSTAMTVTRQDANSNAASPASSTPIILSGVGAGSFYTVSDCSSGAVTSTSIASGQSAVTLYFKDSTAQSLSLAADASGLTGDTLSFAVNAGALDHLAKYSGDAQSAVAGSALASAIVARAEDASNNPVSGVAVTFTVTAGGGSKSDVTVTSGANGQISTSWTLGVTAGATQTLSAAATGAATISFSATATAGAPAKLVLSGPSSVTAGTCSTAITITRQDTNSNASSPVSSTSVVLSGVGAGSFYTANNCASGAVTSTSIASGASAVTLYFKDATAQSLTLAADATSLTGATLALSVNAGTLDHLAKYSGDAQSGTAGSALASAIVARAEDASNNPVSGVLVTFAVTAGGGSKSDVTVTSGANGLVSTNWTLGLTAGATQTLTAAATGATTISFSATAIAGAPTKLVFTGPSSATAGACSTAMTVTRQDVNSNAAAPASSTSVLLSGVGSGSFYTASDCLSGAVTSTSIPSGQSAVTLYFKDATAESLTLAVAATGLTGATLAYTVNVGAVDHLAKISGDSQTGIAGSALGAPIVARAEDASNNPVSGVSVTFTISAGGGSRTIVTGTSGANGQVGANWTIGTTAGGLQALTVSSTGLTSIVFNATATAGSPTKVVLSGPSSVTAGACSSAVTVTRQDANSNAAAPASASTVVLSGTGAGSFYTASDCLSGSVTSTSIPSGQSAVTLYFKDATAESLTLAADVSGLTGGTLPFSVNVGALHHLAKYSGDAQSGTAGAALASPIVARAEDASNNPISGVLVTFAVSAGGGSKSDVTVTSGANGQISTNWTLGLTAGATQTLTAAASGVTTVSFSATAVAGAVTKLVMSGPPSVTAGSCSSAITITRQDANSNAASPASSTSILLSGVGSGSFYTVAGCASGSTTSTSIASGASAVTLYFKDATAESLTLTAAGTGITSGTLALAVNAGAIDHLAKYSGDAQTAVAGAALGTAIIARAEDVSNNPVSGVAVTFTVTGGGGSRTVVTGTSGANGQISANWTLGTTAGSLQTMTVASTGLATITFSATATFGAVTKLALSGPTSATAGTCTSAITVTRQDANSNAASPASITNVLLSGSGSGAFYTASNCLSGMTTSASIASGASAVTLYFKDATAESLTLAADGTSIAQGTLAFASLVGAADHLSIYSGDNQSAVAGTALSSPNVARVEDVQNNPVSGVLVSFTVTGGSGTRTVVTGTSGANGQVSANWTLGTSAGGLQTMTVASTGLATITFNATATFGTSTKLAWTAGTTPLTNSTCSSVFTITRQDVNSNNASPASTLGIVLSGNGSGSFYTASDCSGTATTGLTIASGASGANVYFRDGTAESLTLNAAATSHSAGTFALTVSPTSALAWNPTSYDYGNVNLTTTTSGQGIDFKNNGGASATGCSAPAISGTNAADFDFNADGCGTNDTAAAGSCTVYVHAAPTALGTRTATLSRTCTVGGTASATLTMTAIPQAPNLQYGPNSFSYGSIAVGGSNTRVIQLVNYGGDASGCGSFSVSNVTDFGVDSTTCGATLSGGGSNCTVTVHAAPSTAAAKSATLSRTCTVGGTPTMSLTATGVSAATPYITNITHSGNRWYYQGQKIVLTTIWNTPMTVTGTPRIAIKVGATNYNSTYTSGSGTNTLLFSLTITSAMSDTDGVDVISPIALNSGTIKNGSAVSAALTFGIPDTTLVLVDGSMLGVTNAVANSTVVNTGNTLSLTLTYSVSVTVAGGSPHIKVFFADGSAQDLVYASGSGTANLVFSRTILANDYDAVGATFDRYVNPWGSTIKNGGTSASPDFTAPTTTVLINAPSPSLHINEALAAATGQSYLDFGGTTPNSTPITRTITIRNSGVQGAIGCTAPSLGATTDFSISSTTCSSATQAPGATCTVTLAAVPTSAAQKSTTLTRACTNATVTATLTATGVTSAGSSCNGTVIGTYCWDKTASNTQSCDDLCATRGGSHYATIFYAGSHGTPANCNALRSIPTLFSGSGAPTGGSQGYAAGCYSSSAKVINRDTDPTFTFTGANVATSTLRACACNDGSAAEPSPVDVSGLYGNSAAHSVQLVWNRGGTGNSGYRIAWATGNVPPADCTSAQVTEDDFETGYNDSGAATHIVSGLNANSLYSFRLCTSDRRGHYSVGQTVAKSTDYLNPSDVARQPTFGASTVYYEASATPTFPFTVAGSNPLLIVFVASTTNTLGTVNGITFGGTALTKSGRVSNGAELWYLKAPAAQTANIIVTFSSALSSNTTKITAAYLNGVDPTTPFSTLYSNSYTPFGTTQTRLDALSSSAGADTMTIGFGSFYSNFTDMSPTATVQRDPGNGLGSWIWTETGDTYAHLHWKDSWAWYVMVLSIKPSSH